MSRTPQGPVSHDQAAPAYPFTNPTALEPPPEWGRLRQDCPLSRVTLASGDEALLLTRYEDVRALLSDPRFTRDLGDDAARVATTEQSVFNGRERSGVDITSGPGHQRWRRQLARTFTVKRVMGLRPRITEIADELIDAMLSSQAPVDVRSTLGFPLPVYVICELLGVPREDNARFAYWSDTMLNLSRYSDEEIRASGAEFLQYMGALAHAKVTEPGEDLLSELASLTTGEDPSMSTEELVATGMGLLVAGHETTANMIGKMMAMLLSERSRWEQLLADPSLVPTAVEEVLRFDANPGFGMPRFVSEDAEVAGTRLPRGSTVISSLASANRDTSAFSDASDMDLSRKPNPHLAFGAGPHSCVGQTLARVELQTVLTRLLERVPSLQLAEPTSALPRREGLVVGGLEEVPVRW